MESTKNSSSSPEKQQMTIGEFRVGSNFNPSGKGVVDMIKETGALFNDICEDLRSEVDMTNPLAGEQMRTIATAQTNAEIATMLAVKAATRRIDNVEIIKPKEEQADTDGETLARQD